MQERLLAAEARGGDAVAKLGQAVLYFGCRRRDQDYLYGGLLERWAAEGKLTLFTAFSRQQVHLTRNLHLYNSEIWLPLQAFPCCRDDRSLSKKSNGIPKLGKEAISGCHA